MREVTVYYAYDGEEFCNRELCLAYENEALNKMLIFKDLYVFFDKDLHILPCPKTTNLEDLMDWFRCSVAKCYYVRRCGNLPKDVDDFIQRESGYAVCNWDFNNEIGFFKWDNKEADWVKVDD